MGLTAQTSVSPWRVRVTVVGGAACGAPVVGGALGLVGAVGVGALGFAGAGAGGAGALAVGIGG